MSMISEQGFIIIPRNFIPQWKTEIVKNGASTDVSNDTLYCRFKDSVTEEVGDFELRLEDSAGSYSQNFTGGETVNIYINNDAASATTLRFAGMIEKVQKIQSDKFEVTFTGRHVSKELLNILVTKSYTGREVSDIITNATDGLITYLTGYTTTNVNATTVTADISFIDKPFFDCMRDLANISNFDFKIDADKDIHFFQRNSILNQTDVIWIDEVVSVSGLGDTTFDIKNRIKIYGQDAKGGPIIYTADDIASQAVYGIVEASPLSDNSISTEEGAKNAAMGQLTLLNAKKFQGNCMVYGFPDSVAGEKIWISLPDQKIHNKYRILSLTQEVGESVSLGMTTAFVIEKPVKDFFYELRDVKVSVTGTDQSKSQNPSGMKFSYNFTFLDSDNIESMTDCWLADGKLVINTGKTTGTMVTLPKTTDSNVTQVYPIWLGTFLDGCMVEISADNGDNYQLAENNTLLTITNSGNQLMARVTLNYSGDSAPSLDSLIILYL